MFMKYLKLFESFIDTREIKSECDDILLELKDLGFKTRVDIHRDSITSRPWIKIYISKEIKADENWFNLDLHSGGRESLERMPKFTFKIEDVMECINRLDDYLSSFGFKIDEYDKPERPSLKKDDRYFIRTEFFRNPVNFQVAGIRSFLDLNYQKFH